MRKYKERFLWRKFFYSNLTIILICILIFFVSRGIFKLYQKYQFTKADYIFVDEQRREAEDKMNTNQQKLDNINTVEGQEKYIRETYSVKKEGEGMIIIYNNPSSTYEIPKGESTWESFKNYVKKLFDF